MREKGLCISKNPFPFCLTVASFLQFSALVALGGETRTVTIDDIAALREVSEPRISPDGEWVANTVTVLDTIEDKKISHLWMTSWNGQSSRQLTFGKESEENQRFRPDGKWLAFVSSRGTEAGAGLAPPSPAWATPEPASLRSLGEADWCLSRYF